MKTAGRPYGMLADSEKILLSSAEPNEKYSLLKFRFGI